MRSKFDTAHNKKLYQHWTTDRYIGEVRTFMESDLGLPKDLTDNESIVKMLTLIFPCTNRKQLDSLPYQMDEN